MRAHSLAAPLLLVVVIVAAASPIARAGTLQIDSDGLRCPARARIASDIERSVSESMEGQPDLSLVLESRPPAQLLLRLRGPQSGTERVIDLPPEQCPDVARAATLLVRNWLNRGWANPSPPQPPPAAPPSADPPAAAVAAAIAPAPPPPARLQLTAAAGSYADPDGRAGLHLSLGAEWHFAAPRAAVRLELSRDAADRRGLGPYAISVGIWTASLLAGWNLPLGESARLDLFAGPALFVLLEDRLGAATPDARHLVDGGGLASLRARYRLLAGFDAFVAVEATLRATRETLTIAGFHDAQRLSRARLAASAGVAWEAF